MFIRVYKGTLSVNTGANSIKQRNKLFCYMSGCFNWHHMNIEAHLFDLQSNETEYIQM